MDATRTAPRAPETEKITINVGLVDLGQIDLLVEEGFYSNRTDVIRTAIRSLLATQSEALRQSIARKSLELGLRVVTREELEAVRAARKRLRLRVLGLLRIADDVSASLARSTIESVEVLGAFEATAAVKAALAGRSP